MFKNKTDFCLYLEEIKQKNAYKTYLETIIDFYENYSDQEMDDIARMLNKKIRDSIEREAMDANMIEQLTQTSLI